MTYHSTRTELGPSQGNEKGDKRVEECNQGKNRPKLRSYGQEDRFTLHHGSPGMSNASKFLLPQLEPFNELKGPLDHLNTFKMTLGLQQPPNKILYRSFPTTLKRVARKWFMKLPTSSIDDFEQLSSSFLCHFVGGQCPERLANHLLTIKQGENETLRSYVKRFT